MATSGLHGRGRRRVPVGIGRAIARQPAEQLAATIATVRPRSVVVMMGKMRCDLEPEQRQQEYRRDGAGSPC
jgi:hypothetical protein